jgi:hypothetical protein
MASLNLQRSKQELERQGYLVWIVEVWLAWGNVRRDLYHFADLVAIRPDCQGVLAIQATGEDVLEHVRKLLFGYKDAKGKQIEPNIYLPVWLKAGNQFFIWAWRKRGDRGKRKTWQLRQIEFLLKDGAVICQEIPGPEGTR